MRHVHRELPLILASTDVLASLDLAVAILFVWYFVVSSFDASVKSSIYSRRVQLIYNLVHSSVVIFVPAIDSIYVRARLLTCIGAPPSVFETDFLSVICGHCLVLEKL